MMSGEMLMMDMILDRVVTEEASLRNEAEVNMLAWTVPRSMRINQFPFHRLVPRIGIRKENAPYG